MNDLLDDDTGPTDPSDWFSGIAHHPPRDNVVDDVLNLMRSRDAQAKAVKEINEAIDDNIRKALKQDPRNAKRLLESTDILAHVDASTKKQLGRRPPGSSSRPHRSSSPKSDKGAASMSPA